MNYLVGQGVQATRISIISYGEERPFCTEKNESGWAKNTGRVSARPVPSSKGTGQPLTIAQLLTLPTET